MNSELRIAIGPSHPDFGSWNWLGAGLVQALQSRVSMTTFRDDPPAADIVVFLKFKPSLSALQLLKKGRRLVFMPVDVYGSSDEIDADIESIRCFDLVIVHCRRLMRYFNAMARVEYVDHPLKFTLAESRITYQDGPLLWIGRRCNIGPVVQWTNTLECDRELWVLTDFDDKVATPSELGFRGRMAVRAERWSESTHLDWLSQASIAIDVKGTDFRSRHKPPAKAFDFMASGVPVFTNQGSSLTYEFKNWGMHAASNNEVLEDPSFFTPHYLACCRSACESASPPLVWSRMEQLLMGL